MAVVRCVRAHPARLSVVQHRDLSLLRFRRPFADTGGDLSLSPAATLQVRCQRPNPIQLRVKLEANDGKFRIRLQSFSAQVEGSDRSISSTSRLRVGIHHDWRLRLQTTTYVRPKSATRAEVYLAAYACGECKSGIIRTVRTFKARGNAVSNANVPLLFFSNFFLPTISNYSTRLNSAQLTNSSQLSSSYQLINSTLVASSSRLSSAQLDQLTRLSPTSTSTLELRSAPEE